MILIAYRAMFYIWTCKLNKSVIHSSAASAVEKAKTCVDLEDE